MSREIASYTRQWAEQRSNSSGSFRTKVPPWEEDEGLAQWLDEMEAEDKQEEVLRIQYQEECENRLREAQRNFDLFMARGEIVSGNEVLPDV